jgi:hypothetical protein
LAVLVTACAGHHAPPPGHVSQATWTEGPWPFTVSEGTLKCYAGDSMVTFTVDGVEYALNLSATRFGDFHDPDPIRRDGRPGYVDIGDERQPVPTKMSVDRFVAKGLELCP